MIIETENQLMTRLSAALLLVITILISSIAIVLAKPVLITIPPSQFNWLQMSVALICLVLMELFYVLSKNSPLLKAKKLLLYAALIGFCNCTVVRWIFLVGLEHLPVTTHAYLVNFVGVVTMFLSIIMVKEKPHLFQVLGAFLSLLGLTLYFSAPIDSSQIFGVAIMTVGIVFLAITNNLIRKCLLEFPDTSVVSLSTYAIVLGGLPIIIWGLIFDLPSLEVDQYSMGVIAANGFFSLALTLIVFNLALKTLLSYEASILASTGVVFTAILAVTVLDEKITLMQILGITILLCGIIIVQGYTHLLKWLSTEK